MKDTILDSTNLGRIKLTVRITDDNGDYAHRHFTYLPTQIVDEYERETGYKVRDRIKVWARQEFDVDVKDYDSLIKLKDLVKIKYEQQYPFLASRAVIDKYGLVRTWIIEKMKEETR